jgi:hypothetical protein
MQNINVRKANGESAPFDVERIRRSLKRVHASPEIIEKVIKNVTNEVYDGMTTSKLYRIVFRDLKKYQRSVAGKYNLKRAIMSLGPSGYPFEKFIAALWARDGFSVETGIFVEGACVSHEIDVLARRDNLIEFVECKHHSSNGQTSTVRVPLYFYARFLDLEKKQLADAGNTKIRCKGWLVTNLRFSSEALTYGKCVGLGMLSWDFPPNKGLRERIDKSGLHPITCLTTISSREKRKLLEVGITLCQDLCKTSEVLREVGIRNAKAEKVMDEALAICGQ